MHLKDNQFEICAIATIQHGSSMVRTKRWKTKKYKEEDASFEAFTVEMFHVEVFWVVTLCSAVLPLSSGWSDDGCSMDLWNFCILSQQYTTQPRPRLEGV